MSSFTVALSDGQSLIVESDSVRGAYKSASAKHIGTYVKTIHDYDEVDLLYKIGTGFIDPTIMIREVIQDLTDEELGQIVFCEGRVHTLKRGDEYFHINKSSEKNEGGSFALLLSSARYPDVSKKYKFTLGIERVQLRDHSFDKVTMQCEFCKNNLFDIEDPNGPCSG